MQIVALRWTAEGGFPYTNAMKAAVTSIKSTFNGGRAFVRLLSSRVR